MPKCPECREENAEGTPICRECGATLPASAAQEASVEPTSDASAADDDILELMRSRKKIDAIKVYRQRYGVGLKEAKDAVETLAAEHGLAASQTIGCAGVVLVGLAILVGTAACLLA